MRRLGGGVYKLYHKLNLLEGRSFMSAHSYDLLVVKSTDTKTLMITNTVAEVVSTF